ncbi:peptide MFS transporter [Chitinophagaceae bacterium LWZ2-11]
MEPTLEQIQDFKGKYPKQLYLLFFTEMWERFTFYGMRALLVLFMTSQLKFDDAKSNLTYGAYQSLIYAMPVFGGMIADRLLGQRKSILWGGILIAIGSFVLVIPNTLSFFIGMGIIIVGNGYFKPNISTIVGSLYSKDDNRRDAGFSLFYMGINLGSLLGGLLCGYVGQEINWHLGFGIAGVFMVVGLFVFMKGQKMLGPIGLAPAPEKLKEKTAVGINKEMVTYIISILSIPLFVFILYHYDIYSYIINPFGIVALVYVLYISFKEGKEAFLKILVALILTIFSSLFWAFYEQGGGSLNLFTDRNVNLNFFGFHLSSASLNNSINGGMVVAFSPVFAWLWLWLAARKAEPNSAIKFALALVQLGLGFYMLVLGKSFAGPDGRIPLIFFVLGYIFMTWGELCISPIGLSAITKLSPPKMVGLMMGMWFLASSYGQYLAGWIGALMAIPAEGNESVSGWQSLNVYSDGYGKIALISIICGVFLFILSPWLKKMMKDVH